jgi:hypothetical protein
MEESTNENAARVQNAERRRIKAAATLKRSNEKLIKMLAERELAGDPEYGVLEQRTVEIRGELHGIRLNLTKKAGKFRRLLQEVHKLADALETLHTEEVTSVEELERLSGSIQLKQAIVREKVARTL